MSILGVIAIMAGGLLLYMGFTGNTIGEIMRDVFSG